VGKKAIKYLVFRFRETLSKFHFTQSLEGFTKFSVLEVFFGFTMDFFRSVLSIFSRKEKKKEEGEEVKDEAKVNGEVSKEEVAAVVEGEKKSEVTEAPKTEEKKEEAAPVVEVVKVEETKVEEPKTEVVAEVEEKKEETSMTEEVESLVEAVSKMEVKETVEETTESIEKTIESAKIIAKETMEQLSATETITNGNGYDHDITPENGLSKEVVTSE